MVVIRRELPRTSVAGPAIGLSRRSARGLSCPCVPRPTPTRHHACGWWLGELVRVLVPNKHVWHLCRSFVGGLLALDRDPDGPDEAQQFSRDRGYHLLLDLA